MGFDIELLFTPILAFLVFLLISYLIYWVGGKMAPKWKPQSRHKLSTYACGEEVEGGKVQQSFTLFHIAFIFMIFHIAAMIIATIPFGDNAFYGLLFIASLLIAATALVTSGGEHHV